MWKVVDYKIKERDNGCDVQINEFYLLLNQETAEVKWVDEFEYFRFGSLGLIS
jgi:hypothetical protein